MNPKPIKHLRIRESTEPGGVTRYYSACNKSGTASRDFAKDLESVNCPLCAARVPKARLHGRAK